MSLTGIPFLLHRILLHSPLGTPFRSHRPPPRNFNRTLWARPLGDIIWPLQDVGPAHRQSRSRWRSERKRGRVQDNVGGDLGRDEFCYAGFVHAPRVE